MARRIVSGNQRRITSGNNKPEIRTSAEVVFLMILLFAVFTIRPFFVGPPAIQTDHPFNTDRAFERLERLLVDDTPHPVDSDANDLVRERLLTEIRDIGFEPIVRDDFHCDTQWRGIRCARVQNVMFWVTEPGPNAVMVASHYDSVPAGPGVADDGAGVAASLEIAEVLKTRELARPVLVLITDGEEIGLIGADAFVEKDPFAKMVDAVVSMEARGVRGPVAMFETSIPNGRDIAGLRRLSLPYSGLKTPVSSSFAADIYAAMPNGTDVTKYLPLGMDASNYAIGQGAHFYHTPRDNLAMLDKRSFFHMGANALTSVEAYLDQTPGTDEKQWAYVDILGVFMLAFPQGWGLPLILLGGLAAAFVFWNQGGTQPVRTALFPPAAIIFGVGAAIIMTLIIARLRPELHFGAAHPWALRGAQNAAALLGAALAMAILIKPGAQTRLLMSSWVWVALIGAVISLKYPGAVILFAPSLALIIPAIILAGMGQPVGSRTFAVLAAVILAIITLPATAMGESMLFVEYAAPLTLFLIILFIVLAPVLMAPTDMSGWRRWRCVTVAALGLAAFTALALRVPAYSPDAPRGMSIIHSAEAGSGSAVTSIAGQDAVPEALSEISSYIRGTAPGLDGERWIAEAPPITSEPIEPRLLEFPSLLGEPVLSVDVSVPDIDRFSVAWRGDIDTIKSVQINDQIIPIEDDISPDFICYGRSCRTLSFAITVPDRRDGFKVDMKAYRYGLGEAGLALIAARPDWALPQHSGDMRLVVQTLSLPPNCQLAAYINDARCRAPEPEIETLTETVEE